jgi:hypothetical protein
MSDWQITEEQLYEVNTAAQRVDHVLMRNVLTRTAQESALFPVMQNISMAFVEAYYRYPELLRESMQHISPEEVGHQCRERGTTLTRMRAFSTLDFYLLGRENLIGLGLVRPQDNLEDMWTVVDWWQRFVRSFTREYAHSVAMDAGDIAPHHPERTLQVFEADAHGCEHDTGLREAMSKFLASATQYCFLTHCESRLGQQGSGPYNLGGDVLMHTREFTNIAECDFSWLDGVAEGVPHNNLTVVIITKGVAVDVTDFGSTFTTPENYQQHVVGVGLYTSDLLTDGYVPIGMDSPADLKAAFLDLADACSQATGNLYKRFADLSADQLIDAGLFVNFQLPTAVTQMAGTFRHADWEFIDDRTQRLRSIYNEEFALDAYLENQHLLIGGHSGSTEYYLHPEFYNIWRKSGRAAGAPLPTPGRVANLVPSSVLIDHDYAPRANPNGLADCKGSSSLAPKTSTWTTSAGRNELYTQAQSSSRLLSGRGASLRRADLRALRAEAGEQPWESAGG